MKQFIDRARQRRDADDGQVRIYEGPIGKWEGWKYTNTDGSNTWSYRYEYAGESSEVSREAFRALADGLPHRVYRTPQSGQLVNIELLESDAGRR
jgi:hypothetical protein